MAAAAALLAAGCASTVDSGPEARGVPASERAWLPSPLQGYPLVAPGPEAALLDRAWRDLLATGDAAAARRTAAARLTADPGLHPAAVLLAEAELVAGNPEEAAAGLRPVVEELPAYVAAQLVLGRASELSDDLPGAVAAYQAVADGVPSAAARAAALAPRALEILGNRVADAARLGRLEEARRELERMRAWAREELATLEAEAAVAAAAGDAAAELAALRQLATRRPTDRRLLERRAELEVEAGEPTTGLRILQELSVSYPDDAQLAEKLARARFGWRLALLPEAARAKGRRPVLSRADFASLLYWLFPGVRYEQPRQGRIANDVLGRADRDEIVRVVNLGLMSVDPNLHRFDPERAVTRYEVLAALLALLDRGPGRASCLGAESARERSISGVCQRAARCGLLVDADACLPSAEVGGGEAVELCRLALEVLGVP